MAYTARHFKRIATAIGKDPAKVMAYSDRFEAAAMWFRLNREGSAIKRTPPSAIKNRMDQIANAGRKLLWHLEVFNYRNAARSLRYPLARTYQARHGLERDVHGPRLGAHVC